MLSLLWWLNSTAWPGEGPLRWGVSSVHFPNHQDTTLGIPTGKKCIWRRIKCRRVEAAAASSAPGLNSCLPPWAPRVRAVAATAAGGGGSAGLAAAREGQEGPEAPPGFPGEPQRGGNAPGTAPGLRGAAGPGPRVPVRLLSTPPGDCGVPLRGGRREG